MVTDFLYFCYGSVEMSHDALVCSIHAYIESKLWTNMASIQFVWCQLCHMPTSILVNVCRFAWICMYKYFCMYIWKFMIFYVSHKYFTFGSHVFSFTSLITWYCLFDIYICFGFFLIHGNMSISFLMFLLLF